MTMRISNKSVMQFPLSVPEASKRWPGGCENGPGSLQIIYKVRLQTDKLSCTTVPSQNGFWLRRHARRQYWVFGPKTQLQNCHGELLVHLLLSHQSCSEEVPIWMAWPGCAFWHMPHLIKSPGRSLSFPFPISRSSHSRLLDQSLCCGHGTLGACCEPCRWWPKAPSYIAWILLARRMPHFMTRLSYTIWNPCSFDLSLILLRWAEHGRGERVSLPFGRSHACCFVGQELHRWQDSLCTYPQWEKILFVHWKKALKQPDQYLKLPALLLLNFSLTGALKFVQKSAFRFLSTLF